MCAHKVGAREIETTKIFELRCNYHPSADINTNLAEWKQSWRNQRTVCIYINSPQISRVGLYERLKLTSFLIVARTRTPMSFISPALPSEWKHLKRPDILNMSHLLISTSRTDPTQAPMTSEHTKPANHDPTMSCNHSSTLHTLEGEQNFQVKIEELYTTSYMCKPFLLSHT